MVEDVIISVLSWLWRISGGGNMRLWRKSVMMIGRENLKKF
jgi:hypothetical protein